jgi:hypothetical protein
MYRLFDSRVLRVKSSPCGYWLGLRQRVWRVCVR